MYRGGFNLGKVWRGEDDGNRESTFWDKLDAINIFLMRFNLIWSIVLFIITIIIVILGISIVPKNEIN